MLAESVLRLKAKYRVEQKELYAKEFVEELPIHIKRQIWEESCRITLENSMCHVNRASKIKERDNREW